MRLYEISAALRAAVEGAFVIDEETGEILFDASSIDDLKDAFGDKLEACGVEVKELRSEAEAIRNEEKVLAERRARLERKAGWLEGYMLSNMLATDTRKLDTPRCSLTVRATRSVDVYDPSELPEEFVTTKVTTAPDKVAIRKALKSGEVPGARMLDCQRLGVR